jgi:hypothetical protein
MHEDQAGEALDCGTPLVSHALDLLDHVLEVESIGQIPPLGEAAQHVCLLARPSIEVFVVGRGPIHYYEHTLRCGRWKLSPNRDRRR